MKPPGRIHAGSELPESSAFEVDYVVVGSGAGGGVTAEILSLAGLKVAIVEEGPLASSTDFKMREREAYPQLYQESSARQTADKSITILQGRCVGGSTEVLDLTASHGLRCPVPASYCRILAWPDGTTDRA